MSRSTQRPAVEKIIDFSHRHRWTKYFCAGAVTVIYVYDCLSDAIFRSELKVKETVRTRPLLIPAKILSGITAASFAIMVVPFSAAAEGVTSAADMLTEISAQAEDNIGLPRPNMLEEYKAVLPEYQAAEGATEIIRGTIGDYEPLYGDTGTSKLLITGYEADAQTRGDGNYNYDQNYYDSDNDYYEPPQDTQTVPRVSAIKEYLRVREEAEAQGIELPKPAVKPAQQVTLPASVNDAPDLPDERDTISVEPEYTYEEPAAPELPAASNVAVRGLPEEDSRYIVTYYGNSASKVTVELTAGTVQDREFVCDAFSAYSVSCDNLNIVPFRMNLYGVKDKPRELSAGESVEVTMPVPTGMESHFSDLRVVRVSEGHIDILESRCKTDQYGDSYVTFTTPHFSVFAIVTYTNEPEDIQSSAGSFAEADMSVSTGGLNIPDVFDERRRGKKTKSKKYRIVRKLCKKDLIF